MSKTVQRTIIARVLGNNGITDPEVVSAVTAGLQTYQDERGERDVDLTCGSGQPNWAVCRILATMIPIAEGCIIFLVDGSGRLVHIKIDSN